MTTLTALVSRRAALDYARRPLNLVLLVAVPVVLVFVWGATLADFSRLVGGSANRVQVEAATAGWATAVLAGLGGFFQVSGSRPADRRLAAAGMRTAPVVAGRLGTCMGLAVVASAGGLAALVVRSGLNDPGRAVAATLLIGVIYMALGVLVGTVVRSDMNGSLLITLVWILDVFLGPALSSGSSALTWAFPLHFPTLVLTSQASGHAGPLSDVGWSLLWAVGLAGLAVARLAATTRPTRPLSGAPASSTSSVVTAAAPAIASIIAPAPRPPPVAPVVAPLAVTRLTTPSAANTVPVTARVFAVLRAGMREYRRNRILWVLLVGVPAVFIGLAIAVTVDEPGPLSLIDGARDFTAMISQRRMHAATMVPVTSAFLAGLMGLFIVTSSAAGDKRLVLAGCRPREVLAGRLGVIGAATLVTVTAAVVVSGFWYAPQQWVVFAGANLLIALTYAMIGVLVGPLTGRLGGLYLILLLAFIDVGLGQTVMFPGGPPAWGAFLPGRGASKMLIDGAFTLRFDEVGSLLLGLAWLAVLTAATTVVFHHRTGAARRTRDQPGSPPTRAIVVGGVQQ